MKNTKNLKKGMFVHLAMEYGDVWHQVEEVFPASKRSGISGACMLYQAKASVKSDQVLFSREQMDTKTEYTRLDRITNFVKKLSKKDVRCLDCKEGAFSERRKNLSEIPKKYFKK